MNSQKYPENPVLIVDDEYDILEGYELSLSSQGINNIIICNDSRQVMDIIAERKISVIMLDLFMPYITGDQLLAQIKENYPNIPVVIVTSGNETSLVIKCFKLGIYDYMNKPVDITRLALTIRRALELNVLQNEIKVLNNKILNDEIKSPDIFSSIITNNSTMKSIFKYIEAIADSPKPVLITGESGVGKELIANVIHKASGRKGNFVPVNIGGLDNTLFSDTLFGHKKGAFTGANNDRKGLIVKAEEGTLFLDEIGDLEMESQIKLLRLLQENEYYVLGADEPDNCNIRLISATNANLQESINTKEFRRDLYYRINTHYIRIPPLRERFDDLPLLVNHFTKYASVSLGRKIESVPGGLYRLLMTYSFPGNIRELEAMIYNAVSLSRDNTLSLSVVKTYIDEHSSSIVKDDAPIAERVEQIQSEPHQQICGSKIIKIVTVNNELPTFKEIEDFLVREALNRTNGNQSIAAPLLGITQSSLSRRLKKIKDS